VAAGGKVLANETDDSCRYAREFGRQLYVIRFPEHTPRLFRLVFPCYAKQVYGIQIPKAGFFQALFNKCRNVLRIPHLTEGGEDDPLFLRRLDIFFQYRTVNRQIYHK